MSSYDVGHEISLLCAHILRLAGKSESDVGGVRIGIYGSRVAIMKKRLGSDERLCNKIIIHS